MGFQEQLSEFYLLAKFADAPCFVTSLEFGLTDVGQHIGMHLGS